MRNDERSRFAPTSCEKKKTKESTPKRKYSMENLHHHSSNPKPKNRSSGEMRTVVHCKNICPKPNMSTSTYKTKKDIPLTTPDRNKNSTQNIYNIIFNNSNVNIQNHDPFNTANNFVVINTMAKEPDNLQSPVNIVVKSIENNKVIQKNLINNIRIDRRGVPIVKGGRKHIVSFIDRAEPTKRLVETFNVDSYKQYNLENSYGEKGKKVSCSASLACCLIF
jgi:hypothetical protein